MSDSSPVVKDPNANLGNEFLVELAKITKIATVPAMLGSWVASLIVLPIGISTISAASPLTSGDIGASLAVAGVMGGSAFLVKAADNLTVEDIKQAGKSIKEFGQSIMESAQSAAHKIGISKEQASPAVTPSNNTGERNQYWSRVAQDTVRTAAGLFAATGSFMTVLGASNIVEIAQSAPASAFAVGTVALTAASIYATVKMNPGIFGGGPDKQNEAEIKQDIEASLSVAEPSEHYKKHDVGNPSLS